MLFFTIEAFLFLKIHIISSKNFLLTTVKKIKLKEISRPEVILNKLASISFPLNRLLLNFEKTFFNAIRGL